MTTPQQCGCCHNNRALLAAYGSLSPGCVQQTSLGLLPGMETSPSCLSVPQGTGPATRSKNLSWGWGSPATSLSLTWNYLQGKVTGLGIILLVSCNSRSTQTLAFWSTSLVMKLSTTDQSCTKLYLKCPQAP